jgi:hypothetical protein
MASRRTVFCVWVPGRGKKGGVAVVLYLSFYLLAYQFASSSVTVGAFFASVLRQSRRLRF